MDLALAKKVLRLQISFKTWEKDFLNIHVLMMEEAISILQCASYCDFKIIVNVPFPIIKGGELWTLLCIVICFFNYVVVLWIHHLFVHLCKVDVRKSCEDYGRELYCIDDLDYLSYLWMHAKNELSIIISIAYVLENIFLSYPNVPKFFEKIDVNHVELNHV